MVLNRYRALAGLALWTGLTPACADRGEPPQAERTQASAATSRPGSQDHREDHRQPGTAVPDSDWKELYDRWEYPDPIPDFALIDHQGKSFRLGRLARDHVLIGFIYTRCPLPEACPLTTEKMRRVKTRWREIEAQGGNRGKNLTLLSITLDPDFDTPERLRAYARERGLDLDDWILATGPGELVQNALPSLFNVLALPRAPGDIQHTVKAALLRPGLTIAREWKDHELSADAVIEAILADPPTPE